MLTLANNGQLALCLELSEQDVTSLETVSPLYVRSKQAQLRRLLEWRWTCSRLHMQVTVPRLMFLSNLITQARKQFQAGATHLPSVLM